MFENYLLKDFKNHAADLGPVLVDTCYFLLSYFFSVVSRPMFVPELVGSDARRQRDRVLDVDHRRLGKALR